MDPRGLLQSHRASPLPVLRSSRRRMRPHHIAFACFHHQAECDPEFGTKTSVRQGEASMELHRRDLLVKTGAAGLLLMSAATGATALDQSGGEIVAWTDQPDPVPAEIAG